MFKKEKGDMYHHMNKQKLTQYLNQDEFDDRVQNATKSLIMACDRRNYSLDSLSIYMLETKM